MQLRTIFRNTAGEAKLGSPLEAGYARWRHESDVVAECYRAWIASPRGERFLAYDAYVAALEREERAAGAYRHLAEQAKHS